MTLYNRPFMIVNKNILLRKMKIISRPHNDGFRDDKSICTSNEVFLGGGKEMPAQTLLWLQI